LPLCCLSFFDLRFLITIMVASIFFSMLPCLGNFYICKISLSWQLFQKLNLSLMQGRL
jgi:hypothetical protein